MHCTIDPRLWNLFAGAALVGGGCGGRVAGQEAGDGETTELGSETVGNAETETTGSETETETETAPECVTDSDCGLGYYCDQGMCRYDAPDYCYDDACGVFELCSGGSCQLLDDPPPNCETRSLAVPIPMRDAGLRLTFADVDADGQDELVVATAEGLLVHEFAGGLPTATAREMGAVWAMVAGGFDEVAGEDVLLLVGSELRLYGSNTDGSFAAAVNSQTPIASVEGLIAGELDGEPPTYILGWGGTGAYLQVAEGVVVPTDNNVFGAAAFDFDAEAPGFALHGVEVLEIYNLDFEQTGGASGHESTDQLTAFRSMAGIGYANVRAYDSGWGRVWRVDPSTATTLEEWAIPVKPVDMFAGDLDGDSVDELVFTFGDESRAGVGIEFDPLGPGDCWDSPSLATDYPPRSVALGDYDGDGDQELAILTTSGDVAWLDGG